MGWLTWVFLLKITAVRTFWRLNLWMNYAIICVNNGQRRQKYNSGLFLVNGLFYFVKLFLTWAWTAASHYYTVNKVMTYLVITFKRVFFKFLIFNVWHTLKLVLILCLLELTMIIQNEAHLFFCYTCWQQIQMIIYYMYTKMKMFLERTSSRFAWSNPFRV